MGTRAKPKTNMPATTASRRTIRRRLLAWALIGWLLLHVRRCAEGVVGRRRRHAPLQPLGTVPGLGRSRPATTHALDDDEQEQQLSGTEGKGTNRRHHVEVGELQVVIGNAPRHAGQAN